MHLRHSFYLEICINEAEKVDGLKSRHGAIVLSKNGKILSKGS